ncbi:MAG: phytanoyl-CoA dioxygenase family protein, partial [Chitinophagales bacterium]|nr:phytanoyl-CoA dioxygenase family protein [Chitinophagales bacterium]
LKSHMYTIFPYLKLIEMKAGEALIFDNRTIHASPPNTSDTPRISVGLGFTQKDAKICHYYLKPGSSNTLLKYRITPDFFLQYDNASLSRMYDKGETISGYGVPEEVTYMWEKLSDEEMVERIKEAGNTYNDELVQYMSRLFNTSDPSTRQHQEAQIVEPDNQSATTNPLSDSQQVANGNFWKIYTPANIVREIKFRLFNR